MTLIPTGQLRWFTRIEKEPGQAARTERFLQQGYRKANSPNEMVWIDVPEEGAKP